MHKRFAFNVVLRAKELLRALPTIQDIPVPEGTHLTVCGDVHGQARAGGGGWRGRPPGGAGPCSARHSSYFVSSS